MYDAHMLVWVPTDSIVEQMEIYIDALQLDDSGERWNWSMLRQGDVCGPLVDKEGRTVTNKATKANVFVSLSPFFIHKSHQTLLACW
jgi:hypothetical protein